MVITRKIVHIDKERCNGCGECVEACAEGAIEIVEGKARLIAERYCDGLAACLGECPQDAITIVEREAEAFDEKAVEQHLAGQGTGSIQTAGVDSSLPVCPSIRSWTFSPQYTSGKNTGTIKTETALTHWPVQIRLVHPTAPFLKKADLLIASDCTTLAYPDFHNDFLKGKVVIMGCPKFDDVNEHVKKMADIFRAADIKNITITIMEVPCCSKMPLIVKKAMETSGMSIPVETVVISPQGEALRRMKD